MFKKIITLSLITISLTSCMNNNIDDKKENITVSQSENLTDEDIKIVEVNGIRIAVLICFEIRFCDLWRKIQGADIIFVPALWGKLRKKQLEIISDALAVVNQAYVIVSNSKNDNMASSSAIITPFGDSYRDDKKELLEIEFDKNLVNKMRRYMDVGIR